MYRNVVRMWNHTAFWPWLWCSLVMFNNVPMYTQSWANGDSVPDDILHEPLTRMQTQSQNSSQYQFIPTDNLCRWESRKQSKRCCGDRRKGRKMQEKKTEWKGKEGKVFVVEQELNGQRDKAHYDSSFTLSSHEIPGVCVIQRNWTLGLEFCQLSFCAYLSTCDSTTLWQWEAKHKNTVSYLFVLYVQYECLKKCNKLVVTHLSTFFKTFSQRDMTEWKALKVLFFLIVKKSTKLWGSNFKYFCMQQL